MNEEQQNSTHAEHGSLHIFHNVPVGHGVGVYAWHELSIHHNQHQACW